MMVNNFFIVGLAFFSVAIAQLGVLCIYDTKKDYSLAPLANNS